jgi:hypothetical protein
MPAQPLTPGLGDYLTTCTVRAKRGGLEKLPATRGASNPGLTEPASMFGFYQMPFR